VLIALLSNRGLQAAYNDLGISEAQMVEASLPPSPSLAFRDLAGSGLVPDELGTETPESLAASPIRIVGKDPRCTP
jgi:hypothetical protein